MCDGWGVSGNYHEFAYGLPVDEQGDFYVTLNVSFFSPKWWHGKAPVRWRGWALKVSPAGEIHPIASGLRSPCGVSLSPAGELFVTDNQGDWMPASPIFHVTEGGFYGHPASLDWTAEYRASQTLASDPIPPARAADRRPAAIWLPYNWSRSPGNVAWDETGGRFGPFGGGLFVSELTNGMILRGGLEEVNGVKQGWITPFRKKVGSSIRVLFAPDGTLFCGFTNRGWGGVPPADGIGRIRWTGETPFEVKDVQLQPGEGGFVFQLELTKPPARGMAPISAEVTQYDYDYWWEYGSPERATQTIDAELRFAPEPNLLWLVTRGLVPARIARIKLHGVVSEDGTPLLHDELVYTVNQLPGGPPTSEHVAKLVPPPPARESEDEGWLRLTYGDATDRWIFQGWELVEAELDRDDPTRFQVREGTSHLVNQGSEPSDYVSKPVFGDADIHVDFTLPQGGQSGIYVQGRYGILFADSSDAPALTPEHCGALIGGEGFADRAPALHAYRGAGLLHELDVRFRAPRFDASGAKVENARFLRVRIDDVLLHEDVELAGPTAGAIGPEVPEGPLVLVGTRGPVALGNVRVKPIHAERTAEAAVEDGWTKLLDLDAGDPLAGWTITEDGLWRVEDGALIGEGPRSHIFSPRGDYENFELRARIKISDGGNSGLYFRARPTAEGWPEGYEAQINSTFADPQKTGSLYALAPILAQLVAADTWFEYRVRCREEAEGAHVTIRVNGVIVNDYVDAERRHARGHVALQQHHDGSVVEISELAIRDLQAR